MRRFVIYTLLCVASLWLGWLSLSREGDGGHQSGELVVEEPTEAGPSRQSAFLAPSVGGSPIDELDSAEAYIEKMVATFKQLQAERGLRTEKWKALDELTRIFARKYPSEAVAFFIDSKVSEDFAKTQMVVAFEEAIKHDGEATWLQVVEGARRSALNLPVICFAEALCNLNPEEAFMMAGELPAGHLYQAACEPIGEAAYRAGPERMLALFGELPPFSREMLFRGVMSAAREELGEAAKRVEEEGLAAYDEVLSKSLMLMERLEGETFAKELWRFVAQALRGVPLNESLQMLKRGGVELDLEQSMHLLAERSLGRPPVDEVMAFARSDPSFFENDEFRLVVVQYLRNDRQTFIKVFESVFSQPDPVFTLDDFKYGFDDWMESDMGAAANGIVTMESSDLRFAGVEVVVKHLLSKNDYANAREWMTVVTDESVRLEVLEQIAISEIRYTATDLEDFEGALAIAEEIEQPELRQKMLNRAKGEEAVRISFQRNADFERALKLVSDISDELYRRQMTEQVNYYQIDRLVAEGDFEKAREAAEIIEYDGIRQLMIDRVNSLEQRRGTPE